jgi:hypothetical protein
MQSSESALDVSKTLKTICDVSTQKNELEKIAKQVSGKKENIQITTEVSVLSLISFLLYQ